MADTQDRQDLRLPQEVVLVVERGRVSELNRLIRSEIKVAKREELE